MYDKVEYLSSLGKTQTAAVKRDADIGVAEAERDAGIRVRALSSCFHIVAIALRIPRHPPDPSFCIAVSLRRPSAREK